MTKFEMFRAACDFADRRILWPLLKPVLLPLAGYIIKEE